MRKNILPLVLGAAFLLLASGCFVKSSLDYSDGDLQNLTNLLANPGFAAYSLKSEQALMGWTIYTGDNDGTDLDIAIDPKNDILEGSTSLRVGASPHTVILYSDTFPVRRYRGYYARLHARSSAIAGPQVTANFIAYREDGTILNRYKTKVPTRPAWTKGSLSVGFLKPDVSVGRLQIVIPPFTEGSVWLDDAGCWEVHQFRVD